MRLWQTAIVVAVFSAIVLGAPGCASEQHASESDDSISDLSDVEQPTPPAEEEESLSDKIGGAGVASLVVGGVVAGIVLPLLLF